VATGFTTALLGDERTLREFVIGDHVMRGLRDQGIPAVLYLFNDTYDPLNERQLRVAVEKDERLMEAFAPFCGHPIAEIPDPYACHSSFAQHFAERLLDRLYGLDIHPFVIDVHSLYQQGVYAPYVDEVFERYETIQQALADHLEGHGPAQLFRVQCSRCRRIDATRIERVGKTAVEYRCEHCSEGFHESARSLRGKLAWKVDCAARWNLFQVDVEVFAKAHTAEAGTLPVASVISRELFGGRAPEIVRYGGLRIHRSLSGRLLEILPAPLFKRLLTEHPLRDLDITPEAVAHFAETFMVRPRLSYAAYVRRELPQRALNAAPSPHDRNGDGGAPVRPGLEDGQLLAHGRAYSTHFFGRRHEVRLPDPSVLASAPARVVALALETVGRALRLRAEPHSTPEQVRQELRQFLSGRPAAPAVYPFMRRLLRQDHGPNLTTLLALMPLEYLQTVQLVLSSRVVDASQTRRDESPDVERAA
jgi:hypothetical protein